MPNYMANLPKFSLNFDREKEKWLLENDKTDKVVKAFSTKASATQRGVLEKAVGKEGGSVKIKLQNGRIEEERTYPSEKDPSSSIG